MPPDVAALAKSMIPESPRIEGKAMKLQRLLLPLAAVALLLGGCADPGQSAFQSVIEGAKRKVYPTLVFVKPIQESYESGQRRRAEIFGSGVIISPDGLVVTNNHVAEKAVQLHCVLGNKQLVEADVIGLDPETDLALLKLKQRPGGEPLPDPLAFAEFADSDELEAGQFVMTLGSPFGFERSVSQGIISNTSRYLGFGGQFQYNLWLQTDAQINFGNSGGPLVDTAGRVVGINTLAVGETGIGFSIPSNVVRRVVAKLLEAHKNRAEGDDDPVKVRRAWTGMQLQALIDLKTITLTEGDRGVLVRNVDRDSPAAEGGVENGDILVRVNGQEINGKYVEDLPGVRVLLSELPVDKPSRFVVLRGDEEVACEVAPVLKGKFEGEDFDCRRWNMTVKEITKFSNPRLYFMHPEGGVFIQGVKYPGNAKDAGLKINDILTKVGKYHIKTIADVKKAYEAMINDKTLVEKKALTVVKRGGFPQWITLDWTKDYEEED